MNRTNDSQELLVAMAEAVNPEFYAFAYGNVPAGTTAAAHYASVGWREGRDPNPWFSSRAYIQRYGDAAEADEAPLLHFLETGSSEGRTIEPSEHARAFYSREVAIGAAGIPNQDREPDDSRMAAEWRCVRPEFDAIYYLGKHADVARAGIDPLLHFLEAGWREGRDPNAFFRVNEYLEANPDVAHAGINPFYHYVIEGRKEGRALRVEAGFQFEVLSSLPTLEARVAAVPHVDPSQLGSSGRLSAALAGLARSHRKRLHVSVSHDDFTANVGGLQRCLLREADAFEVKGYDHIHLFPARPLLVTEHDDADPAIGVLVNGTNAGSFRASEVAQELRGAIHPAPEWPARNLAVHSLLGHNPEALLRIFASIGIDRGYFWIHDYGSVCAGLQLLRNDVEFCGAPEADSLACGLCLYGKRRPTQISDHRRLFEELEITVASPSHVALDIWNGATNLNAVEQRVHPHCTMVPRPARAWANPVPPGGPLRVAFLGLPHVHKGWPAYRELLRRFGRDDRYAFHLLGSVAQPGLPLQFTPVNVSYDPNAMVAAVEDLQIDVAAILSPWPETFCFTAHEAIAGGAAVVTLLAGGNIAKLVGETGKGLCVRDEVELYDAFESGDVRRLARSNRLVEHFDLRLSGMTADFVETLHP